MTDLPKGWTLVALVDLVAPEPRAMTDGPFGSNLKTADYTDRGPRVIRLQNIGFGDFIDERAHISEEHFARLRAHEVKPGDLVVASLGQDLPRCCLVPPSATPAIVKADCIRVRLHPGVNPKYVNYALQRPALRATTAERIHGVGRPRLGMNGIRGLELPIAPRSEQARIVAAIEEHLSQLDAAEAYLARAAVNIDSMRRAAVDELFNGRDWPWTCLGDIAELKGGVTKNAKRDNDPALVDVPYLRVANVQRGYLDLNEVAGIRVSPEKADALRLERGDILFNEGGDRDKLGRGWVWEERVDNCIHQNHVFRARLLTEEFDPYFVSTHGNTWGRNWFDRYGRQTTNLASVSLTTLKAFPIPAPPRSEQKRLMAELDRITTDLDALEAGLARQRQRARSVRRQILAAAFDGRLVPQDPDDEPAAVLLGRIRGDREAMPRGRRARSAG